MSGRRAGVREVRPSRAARTDGGTVDRPIPSRQGASASRRTGDRGWSATVGPNQLRIVDLLVSSVGNVVAVTVTVLLFVAEPPGAPAHRRTPAGGTVVVVGWLSRRDAARLSPLLTTYAGSRVMLPVGVAAADLARRPDQGLGSGRPRYRSAGGADRADDQGPAEQDRACSGHLPGVRAVPEPPFPPDRIAVGSLLLVAAGSAVARTRTRRFRSSAAGQRRSSVLFQRVGDRCRFCPEPCRRCHRYLQPLRGWC